MDDAALLGVLHDAASAVRSALDALGDWGAAGTRAGQYHSDLAADAAALAVLQAAGLGVMSEESGLHGGDRPVVVVLDPVDGSTNASRGIPWFATSLCAVDEEGARAAVVVDQAGGRRFEASRGGGARVDGHALVPSSCEAMDEAIVGLSGYPPRWFGWKQYRALGALGSGSVRGGGRSAGRLRRLQSERPRRLGLPRRDADLPGGGRGGDRCLRPGARDPRPLRRAGPPSPRVRPRCLDAAVTARRGFRDREPWTSKDPQ